MWLDEAEALLESSDISATSDVLTQKLMSIHASLHLGDALSRVSHPLLLDRIVSVIGRSLTIPQLLNDVEQRELRGLKEQVNQQRRKCELEARARETLSLGQALRIFNNPDLLSDDLKQLGIPPESAKRTLAKLLSTPCLFVGASETKGFVYNLDVDIRKAKGETKGEVKFIGLRDPATLEVKMVKDDRTEVREIISRVRASAQKAVSAIHSYTCDLAKELDFPEDYASTFQAYDVLLTFQTLKEVDRESAGLPIALATFSKFLDLPFKKDIACTGVVEGLGATARIRAVGGIQAKINAALEQGIYDIIIPEENYQKIKDKDWFRKITQIGIMNVYRVEYLTQAIDVAFDMDRVKGLFEKQFRPSERIHRPKKRANIVILIALTVFLLGIFLYPSYKHVLEKIITPYEEFFYKFPEDKIGIAIARFEIYEPVTNGDTYAKFLNADKIRAEIEEVGGSKSVEVKNFSVKFNNHQEAKRWGEAKKACFVIWGYAQKGEEVVRPVGRITFVPGVIREKLGRQIQLWPSILDFYESQWPRGINIQASAVCLKTLEGIEDIEWTISKTSSVVVGLVSLIEGDPSLAERIWLSICNETEDVYGRNPIRILLAYTYLYQGRLKLAYSTCKEYLTSEPEDPMGYFVLGLTSFCRGDVKSAINAFGKSISFDSETGRLVPITYWMIGHLHLSIGKFEKAIETFEEAISLYPKLSHLRMGLGKVYHSNGNYTEAIKEYENALKLDKNLTDAHISMAEAYFDKEELNRSRMVIERIEKQEPHYLITCKILLGKISEKEGKIEKAEAHFKNVIELYPENPRGYMELIDFYGRNGKIKEAEELYEKVIDLVPEMPEEKFFNFLTNCDLYHKFVDLQFNLRKYEQAERTCKTILNFFPEPIIKAKLGRAYYFQSKLTEAEAIYRSIAQSEPPPFGVKMPAVFHRLGDIYFKLGQAEGANTYYQKALSITKNDTQAKEIHYSLGLLNHSQNKFGPAMAEYKLAFSHPQKTFKSQNDKNYRSKIISAGTYLYLGLLYLDQEEPKKAVELWKSAIPMWEEWLFGSLDRQKIEEAIEETKKKIKQNPEEAFYYYDLARLYVAKKANLEDAAVLLEKAESLEQHPEHFVLLALINNESGEIEKTKDACLRLMAKSDAKSISRNNFFLRALLD